MKYEVVFEKDALKDIKNLIKSGRKSDIKKLHQILNELELNPYTGLGNPEQLKYDLSGFWSRRINKKDRIIYKVIENPNRVVVVVSALGHYE